MSGRFINKNYVNTIDSLTTGTIEKVKNANYTFNSKPPVIADVYHINKEASSVDEGSGIAYSGIGKSSPFRYNLIKDAVFYSDNIRIELNLEYNEDGLATDHPSFSAIVLPNTWVPYANDYIIIKHAGNDVIYKITETSYDTIDNTNNVYRFTAEVDEDSTSFEQLEKQVVERYRMVVNNVGTELNPIIKESIYDCVETIDTILTILKNNYIAMFYNDTVQTFTYEGLYGKLYDPYLIEFMIRNKILAGVKEYIYLHHEVPVPRTFTIEYAKSIFHSLELKDVEHFTCKTCCANQITDSYSLFYTTSDVYYMIEHSDIGIELFQPVDSMLVHTVKSKEELSITDPKAYYNVIARFMNETNIDSSIVPMIEDIEFVASPSLFYGIPMLIYCLERSVKNLMK